MFVLRTRKPTPSASSLEAEEGLRAQGRWEELIELLLRRLDACVEASRRARILLEVAQVFREKLSDWSQALDGLVEAWRLDPTCDAVIAPLEETARHEGRWLEVLAITERRLASELDPRCALALAERMVWWLTTEVEAPDRASHHAWRIRALDSTHCAVHLHQATVSRSHGDLRNELVALERALVSARRPEDQAKLHVLLAARQPSQSEARRQLGLALARDPRSLDALINLETILERDGEIEALAAALETHVDAARDDEQRVNALLRLAALYERQFLKPERAAEKLQHAYALDPTRPEILDSLERCYHATRAWPELVRTLEVAAMTEDEAVRRTALERLAEIQSLKQDDVLGAIRTYGQLRALAPGDDRVLSELARLSERAGDWRTAAEYRSELADLSPASGVQSRRLAAAGHLLDVPDRDPLRAREHFERAVRADPSNEVAWNALLRGAREQEDHPRVARYLEARADLTEAPRLKADLYVELAQLRETRLGDDLGALQAYEVARSADPTNEPASRALLELYVCLQRWDKAQILCAPVVAAAQRDADRDRLCWALRLERRIALGLGEKERALAIAVRCFDLRPSAADVRRDLVESALEVPLEGALDPARAALSSLADRPDSVEAPLRAELGDALVACGETTRARALYERALILAPRSARALAGLANLSAAQGDHAASAEYKRRHAGTLADSDERFDRLLEAAQAFACLAGDSVAAVATYEEARRLRPEDHRLLHALVAEYQKLEDWPEVAAVLRATADGDSDPVRKSKAVFAIGQIARDKLDDPLRALALFEEALDLDPSYLDAFVRLARLCTERRDWTGLEGAYLRMLGRVGRGTTSCSTVPTDKELLEHALHHQLGLVYRDRLRDPDRAVEQFRAAVAVRPDAEEDRCILRGLLATSGRTPEAISVAFDRVRRDPTAAGAYPSLFDWLVQECALDRAWCVASVMKHLGLAHPPAEALLRAHPPRPEAISGALDSALRARLLHPQLDPELTRIFEMVCPALIDSRISRIAWRDRIGYPGKSLSGRVDGIGQSLEFSSVALGLPPPRLYAREGAGPVIGVAAARPPALLVDCDEAIALPPTLRHFVFGKHAFAVAPPVLARALCPSVTELRALLRAARGAVVPNGLRDGGLRGRLSKLELVELADVFASAAGRAIDEAAVQRWSELADASACRAGLLLVGDVELARAALAAEALSPGDLPLRVQMRELAMFALSDAFAEMRRVLGMAL